MQRRVNALVEQMLAAEIFGQRLGHHHPLGGGDADPIAVQRHFDAALGAKFGIGLPGDVGEDAGGQADALRPRADRRTRAR